MHSLVDKIVTVKATKKATKKGVNRINTNGLAAG